MSPPLRCPATIMLADACCLRSRHCSAISRRVRHSVSPMIVATRSMVGALRIEVVSSASSSSIASSRRAMVVWVTDSDPAVMIAMMRSPGASKKNILR